MAHNFGPVGFWSIFFVLMASLWLHKDAEFIKIEDLNVDLHENFNIAV